MLSNNSVCPTRLRTGPSLAEDVERQVVSARLDPSPCQRRAILAPLLGHFRVGTNRSATQLAGSARD